MCSTTRATPWGTVSQYKRARPNGPTILPSVPDIPLIDLHPVFRAEHAELFLRCQVTQVAYQRNRLARWAEKRSAWAYGAPGRCPGLGEPRAFGPGTYRVSRKKTGTLPTYSDPRSWVDFVQASAGLCIIRARLSPSPGCLLRHSQSSGCRVATRSLKSPWARHAEPTVFS